MMQRLLASVLFVFAAASLPAQEPPQPTQPPYLDDPDHWDIHGPNGDIGFDVDAEFWFNDGFCDYYVLEVTGRVNGKPYSSIGLAVDCGEGQILDVWSEDSGNWVEWHWQGDHYKKVGGTSNERTFHPAY